MTTQAMLAISPAVGCRAVVSRSMTTYRLALKGRCCMGSRSRACNAGCLAWCRHHMRCKVSFKPVAITGPGGSGCAALPGNHAQW
tara:strand:+ start:126328 stop:126582 length:255 start_codon:yes stop_codon:yes gene_type:complete